MLKALQGTLFGLAALSLTVTVHGCGDSTGDGETDGSASDIGPSQGESEQCDPDYGADACGAGLFCAAFDGREVPTCYKEGVRLTGEECGEGFHCRTGRCDGVCLGRGGGAQCFDDIDCLSDDCSGGQCTEPYYPPGGGAVASSTGGL